MRTNKNVALQFTILESTVFYVISFCNLWCRQIEQLILKSGAGLLFAVEILGPESTPVSQTVDGEGQYQSLQPGELGSGYAKSMNLG